MIFFRQRYTSSELTEMLYDIHMHELTHNNDTRLVHNAYLLEICDQ